MDYFFYGTLRHAPLLAAVLGRAVEAEPAWLADHAVHWAAGQGFPMLVERPGAEAGGVVLRGLDAGDAARLDYYEGGFAYGARDMTVRVAAGGASCRARTYLPEPGRWTPGAPWTLADWAARWGEIATRAAGDVMEGFGLLAPGTVLARYDKLLARAADHLRAASEPAPARLRRPENPDDVALLGRRQPWARFFAVEEMRLSHRRFDGTMGPEIAREVFVSPDAATVLPYDPVRDRVLLVEQFRAGPFARGDRAPWQLEAVAGLIDAGETPEQAARREAREEAGLTLGALHFIGGHYPSPGARTEYIYAYLGICDLPDTAAGLGGLTEEDEDIRAHVIPYPEAEAMMASGEIAVGPLILSLLWLGRERARLRAGV